jgi:sugar phosphate permease
MVIFGVGQGLGLSALTTGGMAGVAPRDAGVAGGLVNVAHHLGGALGLGVLVTVFDAGTAGDGPQELLAHRVSAALTAAAAFLVLALLVTLAARPRRAAAAPGVDELPPASDLTAADADTLARTAA